MSRVHAGPGGPRRAVAVPLLPLLLFAGCGTTRVRTGLEVLIEDGFEELRGRRVGVVTNPTGVDRRLVSVIDRMDEAPGVELAAIFGPEHGVRGGADAGEAVGHRRDPATGVPVWSLYGATRRPTPEMLEGLDVVVFDIQDIGVRTYTYLATLIEVLEAAAERDLEVWVLDRPVPGGADRVAGPVLEPGLRSFVGPHPAPLRHGLTAGEFARLVVAEREIPVELHVVHMRGYRRSTTWEATGLPWVAPSPNIPTLDTAVAYAGTVLIEGTNLSEGRGTTRPFRLIGAPWVDGPALARRLRAEGLPGVLFRPVRFVPSASKHRGTACNGVEIHIRDLRAYRPVATAVALIAAVRALHPGRLAFREAAFDRLAGSRSLRQDLAAGRPWRDIVRGWTEDLEAWRERRRPWLLYP